MDSTAFGNINSYWNLLSGLSDEMKIELIARLSNSILKAKTKSKVSASQFYGVWRDEDFDNCGSCVKDSEEAYMSKADILQSIDTASKEYKLYKDGKLKVKTSEELLNEL